MKHTTYAGIAVAILIFSQACKKAPVKSNEQSLIESARSFFDNHVQLNAPATTSNLRIKASKHPDWKSAYIDPSSNRELVVVPVFFEKDLVVKASFSGSNPLALNYLTKLVMYKNNSGFSTQVITFFPDSNCYTSPNSQFSGIMFAEAWDGTPLKKYKMAGGVTLTETPAAAESGNSKPILLDGGKQTDIIIGQCTTIYGYNYSSSDPSDSYSWSEPGGCSYSFIPENPTGPITSPSALSNIFNRPILPPFLTIAPPTNIIANVQDYMKCFSNYGGSDHGYQVTVCVDQPVPGSREAWAMNTAGTAGSSSGTNPVDAGHVFLILTENFSGYSIVRNVGFYPQTKVFPWSSSAQGQLNNDNGHSYNISLTVNVDNGQFFNILNYISQGNDPGYMYDLNTNNCTSFAIHAMQAGNINLPATVGSWSDGGFGYDPGDLGEDIRKMTLSSNMTRSTNYNDHPNKYTCN